MGSLGRKLARQVKRSTPEGKEELKQEKAETQPAQSAQNLALKGQNPTGFKPQMQVRQRRSGNA